MSFEWDDDKATANKRKHGVTFLEAQTVFDDPLFVDFYDPAHSENENRFLVIGQSANGRLLFLSYMERQENIRLISARHATSRERRDYEEGTN